MNITAQDLRRAADLQEQIETLQSELSALLGETAQQPPVASGRRQMSAAGRARIAEAQRARWAKFKTGANGASAQRPRRTMSAAAKARLAAVARARWKKAKAAGKMTL
jgi:hypothetical protein